MKNKKNKSINLGIFISLIVISILFVLAYYPSNLESNLTAYYQFSEGTGSITKDEYSGKYNGTLYNDTQWITNGKIGNALLFNKTDGDYVNITNNELGNFSYNDPFSISVWLNPESDIGSVNEMPLLSRGDIGSLDGSWYFGVRNNRTEFKYIQTWASKYLGVESNIGSINYTGDWRHLVLVSDGTGASGLRIYLDNESLALNTLSDTLDGTTYVNGNLLIGAYTSILSNQYMFNGSIDEIGIWNRNLSSSEVSSLWNNGDGLQYYNDTYISSLFTPNDGLTTYSRDVTFNCSGEGKTSSDIIQNLTLYLDDIANYTLTDGIDNFTEIYHTIENINSGSHNWNCGGYSTSGEAFNSSQRTFTSYTLLENSLTYNSIAYESQNNQFRINISYDSSTYSSITAKLVYNNTAYTATKSGTGDTVEFYKTVSAPKVSTMTNVSWYWNFTLVNGGNTYYNTSTYNQSINNIYFGLCNSTLNTKYLNISFKDELNNSRVNSTVSTAIFYYWLDDVTKNETFSFSNSTAHLEYDFCYGTQNNTINIFYTFPYSATGYHPRSITESKSLSNITTNKTLYVLPITDAFYTGTIFQVINLANQPLSDVYVNATTSIEETETIVGSGYTGGDGGITFFLNKNALHTLSFQKTGFTIYTVSITPTQDSYTITLGGGGDVEESPLKNIDILVQPQLNFLDNNTIYNFNYTISSTYWNLDEYGYSLYYSNGTLIDTQTDTTSTGGVLTSSADTYDASSIYMEYYYIVNSTQINYKRIWQIQSTTGRDFSIFRFFSDLSSYTEIGLFGIDNFGRALLSVVIILLLVGGLSYRYGLGSETAIMGIIFGIVLFLDVGVGLIPNISLPGSRTTPDYFITAITFIILIAVLIRGETR